MLVNPLSHGCYRFMMRAYLVGGFLLILAGCSPVSAAATVVPASSPTPTFEATAMIEPTPGAGRGWITYESQQAGYRVKYPEAWTVSENVGTVGELITTFMSPSDGQGIVVSVLNGDATLEEIPDLPNTRCQQVTTGGSPGLSCFDTVASSFSTTLLVNGKQYTIATFGKHPDQITYQSFLASFTVTP